MGMEVIAQLYFHAPRLICRIPTLAIASPELRPTRLMADQLSYAAW